MAATMIAALEFLSGMADTVIAAVFSQSMSYPRSKKILDHKRVTLAYEPANVRHKFSVRDATCHDVSAPHHDGPHIENVSDGAVVSLKRVFLRTPLQLDLSITVVLIGFWRTRLLYDWRGVYGSSAQAVTSSTAQGI